MLPFTAIHRDDVNAKIYAPNMAAPQTDAYLALRHMRECVLFAYRDAREGKEPSNGRDHLLWTLLGEGRRSFHDLFGIL